VKRLLCLVVLATSLEAQQGGFIGGEVRDRSGGAVAAAEVRVQSEETGARQTLYSDAAGRYSTSEVAAGSNKITVRRDGFRTVSQADVSATAGKAVRVDFVIDVLPLQQQVTVSAAQSDVDPTASGLTVRREAPAASLPENGRDVHALFAIMPGATVTPASISAGGQFTVGGQRPNANSFRVDGVSGNIGIGIVSAPGALPGETLPGMSTLGGMQSLASKEETETVELRTADFDTEFGDRPGAQISIETRAGANDFHASVFGYLRPHILDSEDWFAPGAGTGLPSAFLDGWGGGVGGPIWRKRTFFFAALERADLRDGALQVIAVPSAAARENPLLFPYLPLFNAFPAPTGRILNANESAAYSPLRKAGAVTNRSVRLDQEIGQRLRAFARYSDVPSSSTSVELGAGYSAFHWTSATAGLDYARGQITQQLRVNYTLALANSENGAQDASAVNTLFGGVISDYFLGWEVAQVSMEGVGRTLAGKAEQGHERQLEASDVFSWQRGRHELRFGGDYLRLDAGNNGYFHDDPSAGSYFLSAAIVAPQISALLRGAPLGLTSSLGNVPPVVSTRYSSFAQDTLRIRERLNLLFGVRWDVTPSTIGGNSVLTPALFGVGYWSGAGATPVQVRNLFYSPRANWPLRLGQVAPRVGLAYHLKSPDLVFRAGAGLFYDTGLGSLVSNTNPLAIWQYVPTTKVPIPPSDPVPLPTSAVLSLPRVWEWKAALEKSLWEKSLLSLSYFGSSGRKLPRNEATVDGASGILDRLEFTSRGTSNYNALVANFQANVSANLWALVSYTWGHSIDTGSSDTTPLLATGPSNKGTSSFDVRQVFTASLSYRTPASFGRVLGGWTVSGTSLARTGFPFDVTTVDESIGLGFENDDRANLVPGQPAWISNSAVPGGRELNPAAFQMPAMGGQGTLGRNVLTGAGFFQIDASLRRQLRLYKGISAEASVSAFNVLNHPSFASPVGYLGSALFGQSTNMTSLMLGSGSPTTGLTPLFQAGGPRTIELGLRFSF